MKRPTYAELEILVECLLDKVKKLQGENEKHYLRESHRSNALTLAIIFLAEKHPELDTEYAEYIHSALNGCFFGDENLTVNACYHALGYHFDTVENNKLDEVMKEINSRLEKLK